MAGRAIGVEVTATTLYLVAFTFFIVALVYSSVGLGGGSSYTAIMTLAGFGTMTIPMVSLVLNLFVTTLGSYNFIRQKHARVRLILPFLASSIPAAYIGGMLQLPQRAFYWVLLASLLFVATRIYFIPRTEFRLNLGSGEKLVLSLVAGALLGLVSGIVGIGGGVYLVPLIIVLGLGNQKEAAASGAIFIFLNSAAGLASRLQYNSIALLEYWPMVAAAILGGALGSGIGASRAAPRTMERILGVVILAAIVLLARKLLS